MSKKETIQFNRPVQLTDIDLELDAAMERLDGANIRIDELLTTINISAVKEDAAELPDDSPPAEPN